MFAAFHLQLVNQPMYNSLLWIDFLNRSEETHLGETLRGRTRSIRFRYCLLLRSHEGRTMRELHYFWGLAEIECCGLYVSELDKIAEYAHFISKIISKL